MRPSPLHSANKRRGTSVFTCCAWICSYFWINAHVSVYLRSIFCDICSTFVSLLEFLTCCDVLKSSTVKNLSTYWTENCWRIQHVNFFSSVKWRPKFPEMISVMLSYLWSWSQWWRSKTSRRISTAPRLCAASAAAPPSPARQSHARRGWTSLAAPLSSG